MSILLQVQDLTVRLDRPKKTIIKGVSFDVQEGDWLMIIGPNGAGKSTIVKAISGSLDYEGSVKVEDQEVKEMKPRLLAKEMGVVSQMESVSYSFRVREVVAMGRYSYSPTIFSKKPDEEEALIESALAATGLLEKQEQSVLTLSGGELQRVFLAQLLAQDPKILVLDEPTNHLDPAYQKQIFELIQTWLKQKEGRAVISVFHDLTMAKVFGNKALLVHEDKATFFSDPAQAFLPDTLQTVYGMDVAGWMQELYKIWGN